MSTRLSIHTDTWTLPPNDSEALTSIQSALGCSKELAQCLLARGLNSPEKAKSFLAPSDSHFHDPSQVLNMPAAVERLHSAIALGEQIRVVTDYDVDGTTSSLILQSTLKILGGQDVSYHIPDRMKEGYGFSVLAAEKAAADGVNLIVTADIGVKDHAAVARATELGVEVLICDHHLPAGAAVPEQALVLCPPQAGCDYPNKSLAACGVSWKLACAMLDNHPKKDAILKSMLKLVAIGTVADVVDLACPENRAIVSLGLQQLNQGRHTAGLSALLKVSGLTPGAISSGDIGFRIGPRINAAGRLASATTVVELLSQRDPAAAEILAKSLDEMNTERRHIQDRILKEAMAQVQSENPPLIVVSGRESDGWHRGVTGIVAGRLRDHFGCPALMITLTETGCVGSMRSTPAVHAVDLLGQAKDYLLRYGGHPAAAGFSLEERNLEAFEACLLEGVKALSDGSAASPTRNMNPSFNADLRLDSADLTLQLVKDLSVLEPHGKGNERPLMWIGPVRLAGLKTLKDKHLKAGLRVGNDWVDLIWWNSAEHLEAIQGMKQVEIMGQLEINRWQGREKVQILVETLREA
jgi:single-stranded-DNA-specific exonuclease